MANYQTLKSAIQQVIKTNHNNEISGADLQQALLAMINSLGEGYQFMGVATPATNPGTLDSRAFYIANGKGTYTSFGDLSVTEDDVVILYWDSSWHKMQTGIASQEKLTDLERKVNSISYGGEILQHSKYWALGKNVGDTAPTAPDYYPSDAFACGILEVSQGDVIYITTKGGANARAYAVTDKQRVIKKISASGATLASYEVAILEDGFFYYDCTSDYYDNFAIVHNCDYLRRTLNKAIKDVLLVDGKVHKLASIDGTIVKCYDEEVCTFDGKVFVDYNLSLTQSSTTDWGHTTTPIPIPLGADNLYVSMYNNTVISFIFVDSEDAYLCAFKNDVGNEREFVSCPIPPNAKGVMCNAKKSEGLKLVFYKGSNVIDVPRWNGEQAHDFKMPCYIYNFNRLYITFNVNNSLQIQGDATKIYKHNKTLYVWKDSIMQKITSVEEVAALSERVDTIAPKEPKTIDASYFGTTSEGDYIKEDGTVGISGSCKVTDYIDCGGYNQIEVNLLCRSLAFCAFYLEDKSLYSVFQTATSSSSTRSHKIVAIPSGVKYARFTNLNIFSEPSVTFRKVSNWWENRRIAIYGTSIPAGYPRGNSQEAIENGLQDVYSYMNIAIRAIGAIPMNFCVPSGAMRATTVNGSCPFPQYAFASDAELTPNFGANGLQNVTYKNSLLSLIGTNEEPDLFLFSYNSNDVAYDSSDFAEGYTPDYLSIQGNTFVGAHNKVFKALYEANPFARIGIVTRTSDYSSNSPYIKVANDQLKNIARLWQAPCLELSKEGGLINNGIVNNLDDWMSSYDMVHVANFNKSKGTELIGRIANLVKCWLEDIA